MLFRASLTAHVAATIALLTAADTDADRLGKGACRAGESDATDDLACATAWTPPSSSLGLLQRKSQSIAHGRKQRQDPEAKPMAPTGLFQEPAVVNTSLFPFFWFHIPKCGSSFLNAMIKAPGACPSVPKDIYISDSTMGADNIAGFWARYPPDAYCHGNFATFGNHDGYGSLYRWWKGHAVTILRNPEQRIMSAFHDNRHSWPASRINPPPTNFTEFVEQIQGCTVKMLMREGASHAVPDLPPSEEANYGAVGPHWGGPCGSSPNPSEYEVAEAKRRLHDFAFVGIQEEWELSMCLFHATYGGPCYAAEFIDTRHETLKKIDYKEAWLPDGWTDIYDNALYEEGTKIFWDRFKAKGLSVETCQICFAQANVTYPAA